METSDPECIFVWPLDSHPYCSFINLSANQMFHQTRGLHGNVKQPLCGIVLVEVQLEKESTNSVDILSQSAYVLVF